MTYCFDLDGTLLHTDGMDYKNAQPIQERIDAVNTIRSHGHTIIICTGRHERWRRLTVNQLNQFKIACDLLSIGTKPAADYYIDDKAIDADKFFNPQTK